MTALRNAIGNNRRRRGAARFLLAELLADDPTLPSLETLLLDPDPAWRAWMIETVAEARLGQFAEPLNRILLADADPFVRRVAVHAAATLRSDVNLPALVTLAQRDEPALRADLLWTFKEYGRPEGRALLSRAFAEPDIFQSRAEAQPTDPEETRLIAAWGLGKLADPAALDYLAAKLRQTDRGDACQSHTLRAAQAIADIHGWPFTWHTSAIQQIRDSYAACQRSDASHDRDQALTKRGLAPGNSRQTP